MNVAKDVSQCSEEPDELWEEVSCHDGGISHYPGVIFQPTGIFFQHLEMAGFDQNPPAREQPQPSKCRVMSLPVNEG
jgi:hypothetical protein